MKSPGSLQEGDIPGRPQEDPQVKEELMSF